MSSMSSMMQRAPLLAMNPQEPLDTHHTERPAPRRGRPPLCTAEEVLHQIRTEASNGRLIRVHLQSPALYARARRIWGSWAGALRAAGLDPGDILGAARQRAVETRRRNRESQRP